MSEQEDIKNIIKMQTNYSDSEITLKMKIHNNDTMAILREYMNISKLDKNDDKKSVNQRMYSEIRRFMDDASTSYTKKKELQERINIYN